MGFGGYLGRPGTEEEFDPALAPNVGIGTVRIKPSLRTLEVGDPGYNDTGPEVPEPPPPVDEKAQLAEWAANRQRLQAMTPEQRRADSFRVVDPGQAPPARVARAPRPDLQPVGPGMQAQPFQSLAPLMPGDDGQAPSPPPRALASSGSSGGPPGMALQAMMGAGKGVNPDVARYLADKYRDPELESAQARSRVMGLINSASHIGDSMARNAGLQPSTANDLDVNAPVQQYQQRKARTDELEKEDPNSPTNAALRKSLGGLKAFQGIDLSGVTAAQFPLLAKAIEQQGTMDLKREEQGASLKEKAREADQHSGDIRWQTSEHAKDRLAAIQAARENRVAAAQMGIDNRNEARHDRDVQQLEKRIPPEMAAMKTQVEMLDKAVGGLNSEGDIAGIGPLDRLAPDMLASDKAQNIRQLTRGLTARLLQMQSGKVVSEGEVERKTQELGLGKNQPDRMLRQGARNLVQQLQSELHQRATGAQPEVVQDYRSHGGITADDLNGVLTGSKVSIILPDGSRKRIPAEKLDEAIQQYGAKQVR